MSVFRELVGEDRSLYALQPGKSVETTLELLLCIEAHCRPRGDWRSIKETLATLANDCSTAGAGADSRDVLRWLFEEAAFAGNRNQYGASSNSMLSEVLHTRRGIPISLCVIAQSVLSDHGFESHLIGLPGHVVLGLGDSASEGFVDCFNSGRRLTHDQCVAMAAVAGLSSIAETLKPMAPALVALRTLNNLLNSFESERDAAGLARAAALRLTVPFLGPDDVQSTMALLAHTN